MNQKIYVAFTIVGALIVALISNSGLMDYSKVLTGLLMGIGLSIAAFSFFKVLVSYERKTVDK